MQEVCRLSSGVFMVRYVTEDTWFTTSNGESFLLRRGDRAAIYPPTIHKDPEIFPNPNVRFSLSMISLSLREARRGAEGDQRMYLIHW